MSKLNVYGALLLIFLVFFNCKKNENAPEESILKGKATIYVDETITPIVEEEAMVFEGSYDAKLDLVSKSETEILNSLFDGKTKIAVLARNLDKKELNIFEKRKIVPRITKFATDGIAFVSKKSTNETLIDLKDVVGFMKGDRELNIKGMVFDNPNSSTVVYMKNISALTNLPDKDIYSFKTNKEVLKFVSENDGMIGVVGVNWLSQADSSTISIMNKINVLSVKDINGKQFYFPSQSNFAKGTYPLVRDLYIINCQGTAGLGMGFASFIAGDIGQRIVLKSGLLPAVIPSRKLNFIKGKPIK